MIKLAIASASTEMTFQVSPIVHQIYFLKPACLPACLPATCTFTAIDLRLIF